MEPTISNCKNQKFLKFLDFGQQRVLLALMDPPSYIFTPWDRLLMGNRKPTNLRNARSNFEAGARIILQFWGRRADHRAKDHHLIVNIYQPQPSIITLIVKRLKFQWPSLRQYGVLVCCVCFWLACILQKKNLKYRDVCIFSMKGRPMMKSVFPGIC